MRYAYRAATFDIAALAGEGDSYAQIVCEVYPALIMANLPVKSAARVGEIKNRLRLFVLVRAGGSIFGWGHSLVRGKRACGLLELFFVSGERLDAPTLSNNCMP